MRWTLKELHNWGNVTKATVRLYTSTSSGPTGCNNKETCVAHMYMQHLDSHTWGNANLGQNLQWHTRRLAFSSRCCEMIMLVVSASGLVSQAAARSDYFKLQNQERHLKSD